MAPKRQPQSDLDIFRSRLENIIDMRHPTVLLVGLHLIKHMEGLSDEAVCATWTQNPYHQYFCGGPFFEHKLALDRSSMSRWRGRVGPAQLEALLSETLRIALETNATTPEACERVTVDTTVQTKAIAHPSDAHLLLRSIQTLSRMAKAKGIKLRQSFVFVAKAARIAVTRLLHQRAHKQAMRHVRKLRAYAGSLSRDIGSKSAGDQELEAAFADILALVDRVIAQQKGSKNKLYAIHAPEVECIAKGKARTKYEFGVKASIATTNDRTAGGQFIVGMMTVPGAPYDGHTLGQQIDQVERMTGVTVERAYVDLGYRGHNYKGKAEVYLPRDRSVTSPAIKRERKRRSPIEPVIVHLKSDGMLEPNRLKGADGDAINAILCAIGHSLRVGEAFFAWLKAVAVAVRRLTKHRTPSCRTSDSGCARPARRPNRVLPMGSVLLSATDATAHREPCRVADSPPTRCKRDRCRPADMTRPFVGQNVRRVPVQAALAPM
jgi:transposase, IS5 family